MKKLWIVLLASTSLFAQASKPVANCGNSKSSVYLTATGTYNIISPVADIAPFVTGNIRICDITFVSSTAISPSILALTTVTATGTSGGSTVTLSTALSRLKVGRLLLFGTDATIYTVTAVNGPVLSISPNLTSSPSAAATYIDWFPAMPGVSTFAKYWGGDFDIGRGYTLAINLNTTATVSGLITYYIDTTP